MRQRVKAGGDDRRARMRRPGGAGARPASRWALPALAVLLALPMLGGCAGQLEDQPRALPASVAVPLPPAAPRTTGVDSPAAREHKQLVGFFGGEYHAPATERFVDEVLVKLAAASDTPSQVYRVTILNSPIVNAFALPSGEIFVTRGLLALANDTSEVAAVMAHEIAHVTERHALRRAELEKRSAVISQAADVIDDPNRSKTFKSYAQLSLASFSRQQEIDADQVGIRVIAKAGYDPFAASRFLVSLGRATDLRQSLHPGAEAKPDMMATHPSTPERVAKAVAVARGISAPGIGETGHDRYLAAIDGILYGDDPAQGFVRGRRFIHPKLGFAFTAPEDFVLENSAQAVLGVTQDGTEALRLDSMKVAPETTLAAYLASGWIEGLQTQGTAEAIKVNGLPGITVLAKAESWSFRLAAIRVGGDVYRLTFAAKDLTPEVDRRFRDAIDTFRRITPEDARDVRPMRVAIATAAPGEGAEAFAARMAVPDHPLENFQVLNGLDGPTLEANRHYKVVVE